MECGGLTDEQQAILRNNSRNLEGITRIADG
jgi:hypothetical protein